MINFYHHTGTPVNMNTTKLFLYVCRTLAGLSLVVFCLGGCTSVRYGQGAVMHPQAVRSEKIDQLLKEISPGNEVESITKQGIIELIDSNDFERAQALFKKGLKLDPANGNLHFLNALSYHLMSLSGDTRILKLAETGYLTALKLDSSNYMAAYLLGHIYFDQKRYKNAQNQFSYALMYAPQSLKVLRALAIASYYNGDILLAQWAAESAYKMDPNARENIRALIFSKAAAGQITQANLVFDQYRQNRSEPGGEGGCLSRTRHELVAKRIDDWASYYAFNTIFDSGSATESLLDDSDGSDGLDGAYDSDDGDNDGDSGDLDDSGNPSGTSQLADPGSTLPKMAFVDVVILRTEEVRSQAKGINLLDGLQATLGGALFSYAWERDTDAGSSQTLSRMVISPDFQFSGLEYNLNIFNDSQNRAEVLARPSLVAIENKTSRFFSGKELHVQLSSNNSDGSMEDVPIGIHLDVTPIFYGNDTIKITIHASKSFLESLSEEVGYTAFSQTSKTSVDATVVLKFGETLILSGLTENENETSKSGVPILQSIPGVQYLFSRDEQSEVKKSILILLTPRKSRYMDDKASMEAVKKSVEPAAHGPNGPYTSELKKKEKIGSNTDATLAGLYHNSTFYRQFRRGDLELDTWNNEDTIMGSIKRALSFFYY